MCFSNDTDDNFPKAKIFYLLVMHDCRANALPRIELTSFDEHELLLFHVTFTQVAFYFLAMQFNC